MKQLKIILLGLFLLSGLANATAQINIINSYRYETTDVDPIMSLSPLIFYTPASIDPEVTVDGNSLTSPFWEDTSGNGFDATTGGGSFVLNIGSTGRQVEWTASSWMDITDDASLELEGTEYTIIWRFGDDTFPAGAGYVISKAPSGSGRTGAWASGSNAYGGMYIEGTNTTPSPTTQGNNSLAIVVVNSTDYDMWVDGSQVITDGTKGSGNADGQSWNVGGRSDGSYVGGSTLMLDMIAIIPSAISTGEREAIEAEWQVN